MRSTKRCCSVFILVFVIEKLNGKQVINIKVYSIVQIHLPRAYKCDYKKRLFTFKSPVTENTYTVTTTPSHLYQSSFCSPSPPPLLSLYF